MTVARIMKHFEDRKMFQGLIATLVFFFLVCFFAALSWMSRECALNAVRPTWWRRFMMQPTCVSALMHSISKTEPPQRIPHFVVNPEFNLSLRSGLTHQGRRVSQWDGGILDFMTKKYRPPPKILPVPDCQKQQSTNTLLVYQSRDFDDLLHGRSSSLLPRIATEAQTTF